MAAHNPCIQDAKIRQLCVDSEVNKEKHRVIDEGFREIFHGETSLKSRLIEAECGIDSINKTISRSSKQLMWFIGIMVTVQIAAFGGLAYYASQQSSAAAPSPVTIRPLHDYSCTDNFGG